MKFNFKSLLLPVTLALGLHSDFVDQETKDKKTERDVAALLIAYSKEPAIPMAETVTSLQDIESNLKARNTDTTHMMTVTFDKNDEGDYESYRLKDLIAAMEEFHYDHLLLSPVDKKNHGYLLPLTEAQFIQNTHEDIQQKQGVQGDSPLYIQYHDSENAYAAYNEYDDSHYPTETILYTGKLKQSRAAVAFTLAHEMEHYFHPYDENDHHYNDDSRKNKQAREKEADHAGVLLTSKLGAFRVIGAGYCTPDGHNTIDQVLRKLHEEDKKHGCSSHPSDLERLTTIQKNYPHTP